MNSELVFLNTWHQVMLILAVAFLAISFIYLIGYFIKIASQTDLKAKYDFIFKNEIKCLKTSILLLGISAFFAINLYARDIQSMGLWFYVRIFIGIAGTMLIGYVGGLVIEYYYPKFLNSRLKKIRYAPRINPKTGQPMRLLSEKEEDVHLEEGKQVEENILSVDYDVWIDDTTGDVIIEKYKGSRIALLCNSCGLETMRVAKEELVEVFSSEIQKS